MPSTLAKIFFKVSNISRSIGKNISKKDREWYALLQEFNGLYPEKKFRTHYDELTTKSVVFDLGGYEGQWASDIYAQYLCKVHVFEPHLEFYKDIKFRFQNNPSVKIYDFGLGAKEEEIQLSNEKDASSMFATGSDAVKGQLKAAASFLEANDFDTIDLMKINIEGGEYDLLEHLIETGWTKKIKNLQIQFHTFVPDAEARMTRIQNELRKTHESTYLYKFLWENWKLK